MSLPYARHLAGTSTAGGQKNGANTFMRSERQRRRAFQKLGSKLVREFERRHPDFLKPTDLEERDAMCAVHPTFASFCNKLDALAEKFGQ